MNLSYMDFDWTGFQSYITTIGSVLGILSAFILLYRYSRDRPILHFSLGDCVHYLKDSAGNGALSINLSIDNIGERSTTIKKIDLLETRPIDYAKYYGEWKYIQDFQFVPPHSSVTLTPYYLLKNKVIVEEFLNFDILVVYTHGSKKITGTSHARR